MLYYKYYIIYYINIEKDRVGFLYISGNYGHDILCKFYLTMAQI